MFTNYFWHRVILFNSQFIKLKKFLTWLNQLRGFHSNSSSVLSRPPRFGGGNYDCWGGRRSSAEGARSSRRRRRDYGDETETPKASRGWRMGRGYTPPQPTRGSGGASWAPPAGSGAEPRPKTNLVHSRAARKPLVAIILSVFKCMFYTTYRLN